MWKIRELAIIPQAPTNFFQTLHPSISAWTTHGLPLITSPRKMTTVLIRRNASTDSCRNLTALMPRCTKTSFLIIRHYICAHRNSNNLHNAAFKGYSLVGEWGMSTLLWSYINCPHQVYTVIKTAAWANAWPHTVQTFCVTCNSSHLGIWQAEWVGGAWQ